MRRVAVLGLAALTVVGCSSSGPTRADQGRSIASEAGLSPDVADVFALVLQGSAATYTVTYATTDASGRAVQLTITQRPPDRRIDDFAPDGTIESTFRLGDAGYQCTRAPGVTSTASSSDPTAGWSCGAVGNASDSGTNAADPLDPDALRSAIESFRASATDFDFRVEHQTIVGVNARCLVTTRKAGLETDSSLGATATVCVSNEGALLSVEVPTGSFQATAYSATVDVSALQLPVQPDVNATEAPSSSSATSTSSS